MSVKNSILRGLEEAVKYSLRSKKESLKLKIRESNNKKYTGRTWKEFITNIEENSPYNVDGAYRRKYDNWIELLDTNGNIYNAEVTMYKDRFGNTTYELMDYNIYKS